MSLDAQPASQFDPLEEAIFNTARELSDPVAVAAFLDRACGRNPALKARIQRLLAADQTADDFFETDPLGVERKKPLLPPRPPVHASGEMIGRYKLLQKIGEGGMGIVYMAEQQEPVRRRVALKIIKLGMDTASVIARFEAERQALALMDHPNIARIFDGGATETGRPYFVMELVQGVALTEYCDQNHLSISARIELFLKVCEAVQSAHQKGIIHRDLKPSNIMVTLHDGKPVPKVIDFGVAKATNQELTAKTLFTNYATLIGTPAYMSPEQAEMSGLDVDTRSDIYCLGAVLYELLTGTTPFPEQRLRSAGYGEMERIILHEEPQRLSTRISTMEGKKRTAIAKNRDAEAIALRKQLSGDLDSIVMKCLEKDRGRRYESASAVAADILRHLANQPVVARPASAAYRLQKFVRRNQVGVAVAVITLGAIVASLIVAAISYRQTRASAIDAARFQYASDMNLARLAAEEGNFFRALQLLDGHRPSASKPNIPDLRGWEWRYLWKQCQSEEIATLGVHFNAVNTVGFAPDGVAAYSGGDDGALRFWDTKSMQPLSVIPHAGEVMDALFSPDGRWLAVTTRSNLILRAWPSQAIRNVIAKKSFRENTLVYSPDSKLLAFADQKSGVFIWDLEAGREIANLPATFGWLAPIGLAFSPDNQTLAYTESEAGEIILWNIRERAVSRRWDAHAWYITAIFFSPDGNTLISASADRTVKIWDAASGGQRDQFEYPLGFGPSRVSPPRLSGDGALLASAASGGGSVITIQQIPGGREIRRLRGNRKMVSDVAFSADGRALISGSFDGTVRLWNLAAVPKNSDTRAFPPDYPEPRNTINSFALSPDARHLIAAYTNDTFNIRRLPTLEDGQRLRVPVPNLVALGIATGGDLAAFIGKGGDVVFWRADGSTNYFGRPMTNPCSRVVFSPDGQKIAIGGMKSIAVCDIRTGATRLFKNSDPSALFLLRFSPSGQKLVAGYFNGAVNIYDLSAAANPEKTFSGHDYQVHTVAFLPGEKTLISASHEILFWDLETHAIRHVLQARAANFRAVAISPDGGRVAVGGADGFITVWDLATMQEVATLAAHVRPIVDLRFLPDGDNLVSIAVNEMRIWRAASIDEADAILKK